MNDVEEYYLQHFGVKGMKWGVRKNRKSSSKPSRSERKAAKKLDKEKAKFEKEFAKNRTAGKMKNEASNESAKAVNNVIKKYQVSPKASAKKLADANLYSSMELSIILSDHLRKRPVSTPKGKRYVELALFRMGDKTNFSPRLGE